MKMHHLPLLLVSLLTSPAHAWTTESLTITGGVFTLSDGVNSFGDVPVLPGPSNMIDDGMIDGAVDADGLHGSEVSPVTTFMFLGIPWNTFFAHSVETCNATCSAMITIADPEPGAITVTGTPWDTVISADFSGFSTVWNGNRFLQGGQATGTGSWIIEPPPGAGVGMYTFSLQWSLINGEGPFQGFTSEWALNGTAVAVVPEPETYALMLAGLGMMTLGLRRSKCA